MAELAAAPEDDPQPLGPKKHEHEQTQGLEKVTDYVEEKEITGNVGQVDWSLIIYRSHHVICAIRFVSLRQFLTLRVT